LQGREIIHLLKIIFLKIYGKEKESSKEEKEVVFTFRKSPLYRGFSFYLPRLPAVGR
jgi:hypothetical protein